jgi:hypothetical protein
MHEREAFELVTTNYYRTGNPSIATAALRYWLEMIATVDEAHLDRMMTYYYIFARLAQTSAQASEQFQPLLQQYRGPNAGLTRGLLEANTDQEFPTFMAGHIGDPRTLDYLWAEFFIAGSHAPIRRIISTLDYEDYTRSHLKQWLQVRSLFGSRNRAAIADSLFAIGLGSVCIIARSPLGPRRSRPRRSGHGALAATNQRSCHRSDPTGKDAGSAVVLAIEAAAPKRYREQLATSKAEACAISKNLTTRW